MYVCMCVCMYVCMYVCVYVCMYCCGVRVVEGDHNAEGSFHMVMIR